MHAEGVWVARRRARHFIARGASRDLAPLGPPKSPFANPSCRHSANGHAFFLPRAGWFALFRDKRQRATATELFQSHQVVLQTVQSVAQRRPTMLHCFLLKKA